MKTLLLRILKEIFALEEKTEYWMLFTLWGLYYSYSACIALNTSVIDHPTIPYDIYFGFDNPIILKDGVQNLTGHPLMKLFLMPFNALGNLLAYLIDQKAKTLLIVFFCSGLISYSVLYVFRYLKNIIQLDQPISILLSLLYATFSTNLILAFTPESFTISAFLLSFSLLYFSKHILKQTETGTTAFFTIFIGGITITNASKVILFPLVDKTPWKTKLMTIGASLFIAFSMFATHKRYSAIGDAQKRLEIFSDQTSDVLQVTKMALSNFFGAPILFPSFEVVIDNSFHNFILQTQLYQHLWQYLFSITLILAGLYTIFLYRNNKLVQLLVLFFAVDLGIHLLIRYGLDAAFLYGGHWVFLVPLILGWLYHSLSTPQSRRIFTGIMMGLFLLLFCNNSYHLVEFFKFAFTYYHV